MQLIKLCELAQACCLSDQTTRLKIKNGEIDVVVKRIRRRIYITQESFNSYMLKLSDQQQ